MKVTDDWRRKRLEKQIKLNDSLSRGHKRGAVKEKDYKWGYDDGYREALAWVRDNLDLGEQK